MRVRKGFVMVLACVVGVLLLAVGLALPAGGTPWRAEGTALVGPALSSSPMLFSPVCGGLGR